MRKLLYVLLLSMMGCVGVGAQTTAVRYDNIALGPRGPIPNATIAVCSQPANTSTIPCSPLATTFTNTSGTVACNGANGCSQPPLTADALGNYHFYVTSPVTVQVYGPQVLNPFVMADQGPVIVAPYVVADAFTGADIGAQINAAAATLSSGGKVLLTRSAYQYTTPIVLTKPIVLEGQSIGGTCLNFTPSTGTAYTSNTGAGGAHSNFGAGLRNITLAGGTDATCSSTTAPSVTAIGIVTGGTSGQDGWVAENFRIQGFGVGYQPANTTFLQRFAHGVFNNNTQNFVYSGITGSGDNMTFDHVLFGGTGPGVQAIQANSLVIGATPGGTFCTFNFTDISIESAQLTVGNCAVHIANSHIEVGSGTLDPIVHTAGSLSIKNTDFICDSNSSCPTQFINDSSTTAGMGVDGSHVFSNATMARFVNVTGSAYACAQNTLNNGGITTNLVNSGTGQICDAHLVFPGYLVTTSGITGGTFFGRLTPIRNITVEKLEVQLLTVGVTCATAPVVDVWDTATSSGATTLSNGTSTFTTTVNQNYAAGTAIFIRLATAASGCGTFPANIQVNVTYRWN